MPIDLNKYRPGKSKHILSNKKSSKKYVCSEKTYLTEEEKEKLDCTVLEEERTISALIRLALRKAGYI